jgi:RNA polymerase sigma factor (sigma-70 family)
MTAVKVWRIALLLGVDLSIDPWIAHRALTLAACTERLAIVTVLGELPTIGAFAGYNPSVLESDLRRPAGAGSSNVSAVAGAKPAPLGHVHARALRVAGDDRLVALVRGGSEPAFEALYDRHHQALLSFCRHLVGNRQEAEDALQQTFLAAYRGLTASDKPIAFRPWAYAIARNQCIDAVRARRERATEDPEELAAATDGLAEQVQQREDLREMLVDLRRLPENQRAALVLSELGDLSHDEIGDVIGCKTDKVKALVFQAREALAGTRDARAIPCRDIRSQLATGRGGALRRAPLRRHLVACDGCSAFKDEVARQRGALALLLPVAPTVGLKAGALPWIAGGGGAAGGGAIAGGAAAAGGGAAATSGGAAGFAGLSALASTTAAKALIVGAVAVLGTAGGVAGVEKLRAHGGAPNAAGPVAATAAPAASASPAAKASTPPQSPSSQGVTPVRRAGKGGNSARAKERAAARKRERALRVKKNRGRKDAAPGRTTGGGNGKANGNGKADPGARGNGGGSSNAGGGGGKGGGGGNPSNAGGNGNGRPAAVQPEPAASRPAAGKDNGNGAVNGGGAKSNGKGPEKG